MKTFMLITFTFFLSKWGFSQCNPPAPTGTRHFAPPADLFPVIESGTPFSENIYFESFDDSFAGPSGWLTMDSMVIDSIMGLPQGINYQIFPDNSFFNHETGCICFELSGTTYDPIGTDSLYIWVFAYIQNVGPLYFDISWLNDTTGSMERYYVQVVDTATGISNEPDLRPGLFPNPTNGIITLQASGINTPVTVTMFDALGKQYPSQIFDANEMERGVCFNLNNMIGNVFFLKLNTEKDNATVKVLKF